MTIKDIAEIAQVSPETVRAKGKELYPVKYEKGKKTVFTKIEAMQIMSDLRKKGFIQPTENLYVPTENLPHNAVDLDAAFKAAIIGISAMVSNLDSRMSKIETKIEQRQVLLPAPKLDARAHIQKLVNLYVGKTGEAHREVYSMLYREFGYRTHCNPTLSAKNRKSLIIDFIDSEGQIETLEAIALEILT